MTLDPNATRISLDTTARFIRGAPWRLSLLHDVSDYRLIWTTKGQALAALNGRKRGIGVHCAIIVPSGTLFSLDLGRTGAGLVLALDPAWVTEAKLPDAPQVLQLRSVQEQAEITGALDAIHKEAQSDQPFHEDACRAYAALLSVSLRRRIDALPEPQRMSGAQRLVNAFSALVRKHFADVMTMADFARILGVTPTHLSRSCKDCLGLTAADILAQRSLYAARDLIETTDTPLKDIADQLGFGSAAYFSRFIQNHTGRSPRDLRNGSKQPGQHHSLTAHALLQSSRKSS
ncbi:Methylphosphotriester-DNA--protein-cysteine S-methyltransferase [Thalassovita gelatinovora]|uniref:Methylphosphotriester-DNA--protein-cysteine S-methyltransferase n=1 Tax=Thalassovita gelatinovora TaxID=53501 RepID=A0A0P1FKE2_THAGE|nr:AraC family transcriptional regulator [Thalassovita gelatinovora]QIZ79022.1 AraC family transcriptional regulator [Thalassovita gelatinovora]CUH68588.1 Methylphosphotriester-DNA--protein-cysteine S-methyltransferase [Thalassovita gelatinovora]SEQ55040.1 AraC family transcriptional regulator, transcriptional activator of pobA [Thalassovita gelatinovora]